MKTTTTTTRKPQPRRAIAIKGQCFDLDTGTGRDACMRVINRMVDNVERLRAAELNALAKLDRLAERGDRASDETRAAIDALNAAVLRPTATSCKRHPRSV